MCTNVYIAYHAIFDVVLEFYHSWSKAVRRNQLFLDKYNYLEALNSLRCWKSSLPAYSSFRPRSKFLSFLQTSYCKFIVP